MILHYRGFIIYNFSKMKVVLYFQNFRSVSTNTIAFGEAMH